MTNSRATPCDYFASLQGLRSIAATAVVLFHLRPIEERRLPGPAILDNLVSHADAGVDLFFVISGFVMTTILRGHAGGANAAVRFLSARAWRVLPMYWLFTSLVVVVMLAAPGMVNSSFPGQSALSSYLLLPHFQPPLLTVGWTLIHEAYFYLVFALAITTIGPKSLTPFLILWCILTCIPHWLGVQSTSPWQRLIASPLTLEFIAGALLGLHWHRMPAHIGGYLMASGIAIYALAAMLLPDSYEPAREIWLRVACFGTASALIVVGAVMLEAGGRVRVPQWLRSLGNASYSLYLSHIFVLSAIGRAWSRLSPSDSLLNHAVFLLVAMAASLFVAHIVHRSVERPLLELPKHLGIAARI